MGWSCSNKAHEVLEKIFKGCGQQTGKSNVYTANGKQYFFETSRTEHEDGGITGSVWRFINETQCKPSGTFKIDGFGQIVRMPKAMRDLAGE